MQIEQLSHKFQHSFIEIAHIYSSEHLDTLNLDYLHSIHKCNSNHLAIFIDDVNSSSHHLNISQLNHLLVIKYNLNVTFYYESHMLTYYSHFISLFKNSLQSHSNKLGIFLNDSFIPFYDLIKKKPTCLCLSIIWTLFRLGFYSHKYQNLISISFLNKKYIKLEKKVIDVITLLHQTYPQISPKRCFYSWL